MSNTDSATSLEIDSILNQASDDAGGLTDFGQLPFKEPLAKVLASLEEEARLNEIGRYIARDRMVMHSRNRLLQLVQNVVLGNAHDPIGLSNSRTASAALLSPDTDELPMIA